MRIQRSKIRSVTPLLASEVRHQANWLHFIGFAVGLDFGRRRNWQFPQIAIHKIERNVIDKWPEVVVGGIFKSSVLGISKLLIFGSEL